MSQTQNKQDPPTQNNESVQQNTQVKPENKVAIVEGKLWKIIHEEGTGQYPKKGQEVHALYRGTLQNGSEFDSNQNRDEPFKFTLGQGQVIKGWDQGFASMKIGQKATLICSPEYAYGARGSPPRIPANSTLNFQVQLLNSTDKKKQKWQLSEEEKLANATNSKNKGNELFKKGDFKNAVAQYDEGIESIDGEDSQQAKTLLKVLRLNTAQAQIKIGQNTKAIQNCTKVLKDDPQNSKALYRRGVAYLKNQQFQQSKNDFNELLKHEPQNVDAKNQIKNVQKAIIEYKKKQKKVFGSMFSSKSGIYQDVKVESKKQEKNEQQEAQQGEQPTAVNIQQITQEDNKQA